MCYSHRNYQHYEKGRHHARHHAKRAKWKAMKQGFFSSLVPVNIQELDEAYTLALYAAGYQKEDFKLSLVDDTLTISAKAQEQDTPENARWQRRDFVARGFQRAFELNDKIDTDNIKAEYKEGVLLVTLPKSEDHVTTRQDIDIE